MPSNTDVANEIQKHKASEYPHRRREIYDMEVPKSDMREVWKGIRWRHRERHLCPVRLEERKEDKIKRKDKTKRCMIPNCTNKKAEDSGFCEEHKRFIRKKLQGGR